MAGTKRLFRVGPLTRRASLLVYTSPPRVLFSLFRPIGLLFHRQDSLAKLLIEIWAIFQMVLFFVEKLSGQLSEEREGSCTKTGMLLHRTTLYYTLVHLPCPIQFSSSQRNSIASIDYSNIWLRHLPFFHLQIPSWKTIYPRKRWIRIDRFSLWNNKKWRTIREIFGWRVEMDFRKKEDERLIRGERTV